MTAITSPTEISIEDLPCNVVSGTGKRRLKVFVRATSEGTADTIDLQSFVGERVLIEHLSEGVANAAASTASTYAGGTITTAQGAGAYVIEATVSMV